MKNEAIPRLKFRKFNGTFYAYKLGDISKHVSGTALEKYFNPKGYYKVISIGSYGLDHRYIDQGIRAVSNRKVLTKRLSCGDLAMNLNDRNTKFRGLTLGNTLLISKSDKYVINQRSERIIPDESEDSVFLYFYLNSLYFKHRIMSIAQGDTQMYVKWGDVNKLITYLPSLPEQQAIGKFFTKLDKLIQLQQKKVSLLKKLKRGYLQKLFPRKGESVPRLRFKGFHDKWKNYKLKDISRSLGGTALEKYFSPKGKYKVISIGSYGLNNRYVDQGLRAIPNKKVKSKIVHSGDLTMILNDKTRGRILGKVLLINTNNKYVINQRSERITPDINKVNSLFLFYEINSPFFKREIFSIAQGATQIYINYSSVSNLIIKLPNKEEQVKINHYLYYIDDMIINQNNKLIYLRKLKEAYLQKMFC